MAFNTKSVLLQLVKQGRLRALAVTSAARWPELPEAPTLTEVGIFPYPLEVWFGIVGPAGPPRAVVARLNGAINEALRSTDVRANFMNLSIRRRRGAPEDFPMLVARETATCA